MNTSRHRRSTASADTTQLLTYAVKVTSLNSNTSPLQVGEPGTVAISVNNPGGYSDQPATDYVQVASIVFDFGPAGNDGNNLTAQLAWTSGVTAPSSGWSISVTGLAITFTPPPDGNQVYPKDGLVFTFPSIPVNGTLGTFILQVSETASSPGDPISPVYPARPSKARSLPTYSIGKFPEDFALSDLQANPSFVEPDVPTALTLSWQGSDAYYELDYPDTTIRQHADGSLLGPSDSYPNTPLGDPPLILEAPTLFVLTASYTPSEGSPIQVQRPANVGINYPEPVINSFSVSPSIAVLTGDDPIQATITWSTSNGDGITPVVFAFDPVLSEAEQALPGNTAFAGAFLPSHSITFLVLQPHKITITVAPPPFTTAATQTSRILGLRSLGLMVPPGSLADAIGTFSPDGKLAAVLYPAGPPQRNYMQFGIYAVSDGAPQTWVSTAIGAGQPLGTGFTFTADGQYIITPSTRPYFSLAFQITESANPTTWPVSSFGLGGYTPAASPDGKYIFANEPRNGLYIAEVSAGKDPSTWPVAQIQAAFGTSSDQSNCPLVVSPDSSLLVIPGAQYLFTVAIDSTIAPGQWKVTRLNYQPTTAAFTKDGKYLIVCTYNGVVVLTVDPNASPDAWTATPIAGPTAGVATLTPDGGYLFIVTDDMSPTDQYSFWVILIDTGVDPSQWTTLEVGGLYTGSSGASQNFISPDGSYLFVNGAYGFNAAMQVIQLV